MSTSTKEKVFCGKCIYFSVQYRIGIVPSFICKHPTNCTLVTTFLIETIQQNANPKKINKYNDCPNFAPKVSWYRRVLGLKGKEYEH